MSEHELMPAISLMERKVADAERKLNGLISALNVLREEAGLPPRPTGGGSGGSSSGAEPVTTQIKPDTFFGQKQQTAMRSYLEMRKAQALGPAKPREIYDALAAGGYQFEAKDMETALVGLRALLRKRSETFIKLPNGAYGLVTWYPNAKRPKPAAATASEVAANQSADVDDDEVDVDTEAAASSEEEAAA